MALQMMKNSFPLQLPMFITSHLQNQMMTLRRKGLKIVHWVLDGIPCVYLLMLHDITTLEELSHAGLIALYLQSNTEDNEGLEMRLMGKYVHF